MNWINTQEHVAGILTPDVNGKRKLYDIAADAYHDLEVDDSHENKLTIGNYIFDQDLFTKAQQILLSAIDAQPSWLLIDEVGKLEVHHRSGLEPAVSFTIKHYQAKETEGNLLLVIRDYLLDDCITCYYLQNAVILDKEDFL